MRRSLSGRYLIWLIVFVFVICLVASEIWILKPLPLDGEQIGNPKNYCGEIEFGQSYLLTARQFACTFAAKNIIFIDAHHDTINAISALFVALFTFTLWRSTDKLWQASKTQSADMQGSITQATRAAGAMETFANYMGAQVANSSQILERQKVYSQMQLRAYLAVVPHDATFQEKGKDYAFEGRGLIVNKGVTPAHKVTYWANCDVLSVPIPNDFTFPKPQQIKDYSAVLGAQNTFVINATLATNESPNFVSMTKRFVPDNEVDEIKSGKHRALYMWGAVSYEDAFGDSHSTKFSFWFIWQKADDKEVKTSYHTANHNEAD